jgi:DNA polymerase III gamma/tau subunit
MDEETMESNEAARVCPVGEGLPLHTKYRPPDLDRFVGGEAIKAALGRILEDCDRRPHVYLFSGPAGCGKTTLSRILAWMVGCDEQDLVELDASAERGINEMRQLRRDLQLRPLYGSVKAYIIDEAHGLTRDAQNALLKALEECPEHAFVVLCSTEPDRLLDTIRQRCTPFEVSRLGDNLIFNLLADVCDAEGFQTTDAILDLIVEKADGVPRNALTFLGVVHAVEDPNEAALLMRAAEGTEAHFQELAYALMNSQGLRKVVACYKNMEERDPVRVRVGLANYMKAILMNTRTPGDVRRATHLLRYINRATLNYKMLEAELMMDFSLMLMDDGGEIPL